MILNKQKVNEFAEKNASWNGQTDFKAGVAYAEKEMAKEILDIVALDDDEFTDGEVVDMIVKFLK